MRRASGAGALVAAAGLVASAAVAAETDEARTAALIAGAVAVVVLTAAIAIAWARAVTWGVAVLGVSYAASLAGRGLDLGAAFIGALLLLVFELAHWSVERGSIAPSEPSVVRARAAGILAVACVAAAVGFVVLGASAIPAGGGFAGEVAGGLGAAGVVALAAFALRRARR